MERGSVSRSTFNLQTVQFISNTFCLAKLLRVEDPRSGKLKPRELPLGPAWFLI